MKIKIDVTLNEKGQKLTSKKIHSIRVIRDGIPKEDEIEKIIEEEVPKELIDRYDVIHGGFVDLVVGDLVKIVYPFYSVPEITKIIKINNESITVEGCDASFGFDGLERGKRKQKARIELPTQDDIDLYNERQRRDFLVTQIKEVVEDLDELGCYKTEVLEEIDYLLRDGNSRL